MPFPNPYDSITTPFQSGCSTCNKSSDYSRVDGLNKPSSSADLKNNGYTGNVQKPQAHDLMSSNWGVVTNSTGGAKKKKSKKSKKKAVKRSGKKVVRRSKKVVKKSSKKVVRRSKKIVRRSISRVKKSGKRIVKGSKKLIKRSATGVKRTINGVSRTVRRVSKPVVNKIKNLGRLLGIKVSKKSKKVKKSKRVKKSKKQRGGDSNWGSTGMPSRWYNPKAPSISNNASNPNAGGGLATNKGLIVHNLTDKNFGTPSKYTGKVEPYNPSASEWASVSGGAKKKKKSKSVKKSKKVKKVKKSKKSKKVKKSKGVKKSKKKSPKKKASQRK